MKKKKRKEKKNILNYFPKIFGKILLNLVIKQLMLHDFSKLKEQEKRISKFGKIGSVAPIKQGFLFLWPYSVPPIICSHLKHIMSVKLPKACLHLSLTWGGVSFAGASEPNVHLSAQQCLQKLEYLYMEQKKTREMVGFSHWLHWQMDRNKGHKIG